MRTFCVALLFFIIRLAKNRIPGPFYLTSVDEAGGVQHVLFSRNSGTIEIPEGLSVDWEDTLCRRALEDNRFVTDDVPSLWPDSGAAAELGLKSYMSIPVRTDDGVLYGTLCGASGEAVPGDEQVQEVLRLFAELIARQVDRETHARAASERADRAESRVEAMTFMSDLGSLCLKARELEPVLHQAAVRLCERPFWAEAMPFRVDNAGIHFLSVDAARATEPLRTAVEVLEPEAGDLPCVFQASGDQALARCRHAVGLDEDGVVALVRARGDEGLEGGVLLVSESGRAMPERERDLATTCGSYLCLLAERISHLRQLRDANRQMEVQAMHDALTGLPNRRYLMEELQRMLGRGARAGECVHVAFIDLDHFKQINDDYGHEVGDQFLQAMADRLTTTIRHGDMAARYGGDEFVLVAVGSEPDQAEDERESIRTRIREAMRGIIHLSEMNLKYGGPSVGVISCGDDTLDPHLVLARADQAMYEEKRSRRGY